ncbi:hypothetical protein [Crossiella sp. CA198]|uniref:hypothetical protein n=1 Tax=Crossiella sp. CA198 TaxID=3455607 RepID=UPI003F8D2143
MAMDPNISKARLALGTLVLLALGGCTLALMISLDVGAFLARTLPIVVMIGAAVAANSMGWFNKKVRD